MITYLCGGINGLSDFEATDWRTRAKQLLKTETLDPMRRDYRGMEDEHVQEIIEGDVKDITDSDFLLVNAEKPSWGTAMEVQLAYNLGRKIYAVVSAQKVSPWLRYHTTEIFRNLNDAIDRINKESDYEQNTFIEQQIKKQAEHSPG